MSFSTQRSSRSVGSRTPPTISRPIPQEPIVPMLIAKPASSPKSASSPKASRLHRPSITSPMNWLGRSSSSASTNSQPYAPSKPIRISEPQMQSTYNPTTRRSGPLGAGATVVRTPQEALADTRSVRSLERDIPEEEESEYFPPQSPPLPPLPLEDEEGEVRTVASRSSTPSRPTRPCPPVPPTESSPEPSPTPSLRPSLKVLDSFPPVPALPANLPSSAPPPPFDAILLSPAPSGISDPSKIIVSIETTTVTYKTTLGTLMSRPSFLSSYLESLLPSLPSTEDEDEVSVYSRQSEVEGSFHSIFHNHLTTSGLLPPPVSTMHIFLDRPSAPYVHILSYLRTPVSTPECPAVLPRAAQLTSSSSSRLEALLELRDEARYLDLDELYKLCSDELRARHYFGLARSSQHTRGMSSASVSTNSAHSLGTLRENEEVVEGESTRPKRLSRDSGVGSSCSSNGGSGSRRMRSPANSIVAEVGWHSASPVPVLDPRGKKASIIRPTGEWI